MVQGCFQSINNTMPALRITPYSVKHHYIKTENSPDTNNVYMLC